MNESERHKDWNPGTTVSIESEIFLTVTLLGSKNAREYLTRTPNGTLFWRETSSVGRSGSCSPRSGGWGLTLTTTSCGYCLWSASMTLDNHSFTLTEGVTQKQRSWARDFKLVMAALGGPMLGFGHVRSLGFHAIVARTVSKSLNSDSKISRPII